jgi:hypothetical protein
VERLSQAKAEGTHSEIEKVRHRRQTSHVSHGRYVLGDTLGNEALARYKVPRLLVTSHTS